MGKSWVPDLHQVANLISKIFLAPLELVKIVLQTQDMKNSSTGQHTGSLECLSNVLKQHGFSSFFQGTVASLLRHAFSQHFLNSTKDTFKRLTPTYDYKNEYWLWLGTHIINGSLAGIMSLLLVCPLDVARTRLAVDFAKDGVRQYNGIVDCLGKVAQTDGISALFNGFEAAAVGLVTYRLAYFVLYDNSANLSKRWISRMPLNLKGSAQFMYNQSVAILAMLISHPLDTVRRRLIMQGGTEPYGGTWDCAMQIVRNGGAAGLWAGAVPGAVNMLLGALIAVAVDRVLARPVSRGDTNRRA